MILLPQETERFYRIWFPLLNYVNRERHLFASFPAVPGTGTVRPADAGVLRQTLWTDVALLQQFVSGNPAGLSPDDLALAASWGRRVAGSFYIMRYLKRHAILLSSDAPARAYGVLGLTSPLEKIVGPELPLLVHAVLLPFEARIIYDSLLAPSSVSFGSGIRRSLNEAYRNAQEREGVITTLIESPAESRPAAQLAALRRRNTMVLTAFRRDLAKAGLIPRTAEQHFQTIETFANQYLLAQDPPAGLLDLTSKDLQTYLAGTGTAANRVSFRRFVRFLRDTERLEYFAAEDLSDALKSG